MRSLLNPSDRHELRQRVGPLRPDSPARWGKFTAPQMLSHAIQSLGMMSGSVPTPAERVPWFFRRWPVKHLLIYVIPFAKGLPTSAVLLARQALESTVTKEQWAAECRAFESALESLARRAEAGGDWPPHPAFGPLSATEWGVLQYRHLDHHFRQFGL